jgi:hypothetical protein
MLRWPAMGLLLHTGTGRLITLEVRSLVGRGSRNTVALDDPRASAEHAVIAWQGDGWELRDLGSRNGTWVDGERVERGKRVRLRRDSRVSFGVPDATWVLVDDRGTGPAARNQQSGDLVHAAAGLLALPTLADPRATIFPGENGQWLVDVAGEVHRIADGATLALDGIDWTIFLPSSLAPVPGTLEATGAGAPPTIAALALSFVVSSDEEHVDIGLRWSDREKVSLPPRSSHYLMLTLARARLADAARGVPEGEQGWLYSADLATMLGYGAEHLNVEIFRARALLSKLGVVDAGQLIERRASSRQLRLGVARLQVTRA